MKKLYQVKVHTKEQLGLSGVRFLDGLQILDTEKDIETQIRENYLRDYDITIVEVEYYEVTFNKYNIVIEEKEGYVVVLHNCKNGVKLSESKLFENVPDESMVQSFVKLYGAERATIEKRQ